MRKLTIAAAGGRKILCLGAHSDDIEIGCGGAILKLLRDPTPTEVLWIVFSADEIRAGEARESADCFLSHADVKRVHVESFRDGFFPYQGTRIKEYFEELKRSFNPDIIFTHWRGDSHQDHRLIAELTWNTFRNHLILEYEILKYDGDLGRPNVFVTLTEELCHEKVRAITRVFRSQSGRHWFTEDAFRAIMRIRGIEISAPEGFAEGFHGRKLVI